jgi:hypothetical protein
MFKFKFPKLKAGMQYRRLTLDQLISNSTSTSFSRYLSFAISSVASLNSRFTSHVCHFTAVVSRLTSDVCSLRSHISRLTAYICLLSGVLFIAVNGYSQSQNATQVRWFAEGNNAYTQGNYAAAIEAYNHIVQSGFENEWVFYNLGNAYFKQNRLGMAILCYEKAVRLAPGEKEIRENLEFASSRKVDKIEVPIDFFLIQWLKWFFNLFSLNQETGLVLLFSFLGGGALILILARVTSQLRTLFFIMFLVFLGVTLLFGVSNFLRVYHFTHDQSGIVMVQKADILSGPAPENPVLFSLHEGTKVEVRQESGDWFQINLPNGWSGWVRKNTLGLI